MVKKRFVLTCMSFALSFPLFAEKDRRFSLRGKFDEAVHNHTPDPFVQLKGSEEAKARAYFDELKQERKNYYLRNKEKHGEAFTLSYDIALVASRMMEKFYGGHQSFKEGLKCFHKLADRQGDVKALEQLYDSCRAKLADFRMKIKDKQLAYHTKVPESILVALGEEVKNTFTYNTKASNYLSRALPPIPRENEAPKGPEMNCYYHGGSVVFATPFGGFAGTGHRLKCRSKLGRKSVYKVGSANFSLGFAAIFSYKKARFYQNEDGTYRRKTFAYPYEDFRRARAHGIIHLTAALGLGVTGNLRNLKKFSPESRTYGLGLASSFGGGGIVKDKKFEEAPMEDKDHDFRELFEALGLEFA